MVRLACQRHIDDIEDSKHANKRGLFWDLDAALRAINFFPDVLVLPEIGSPFHLEPSQQFIVGSLFGWKQADMSRRFRHAFVEEGKGNGKTPLAAGIGLYMMTADGEREAQCFAAATTREQAQILFQDAVKMVASSPVLHARIATSGKLKVFNLADLASGSFFRPVSSEHRALDGKRVHFAALDEVHEHPNSLVVDKIRAGTKGRRQALIFEITNSGYDRHSVCWEHHQFSVGVLEGNTPNDQWFAYVCTLDEGDDWHNPAVWAKVNPLLGVSIPAKYIEEQVAMADGIPGNENIVKRLNFCIWTEQSVRWMPMETWDACGELKVDPDELKGETCYGGLDLALTRDLSAFVLIFPPNVSHSGPFGIGDRPFWVVLAWFWLPADDLKARCDRDHAPYDVWARQGFLTLTPGNVTDHDFIETKILELSKQYEIAELAYDPSRAVQLVTHLQEAGLTMVEYAQHCTSMNAAVQLMEKLILEKKLAHGNNPVLRANCANAVTVANSNGNVKFDKGKATGRIDGMTALANAFGRARFAPQPFTGDYLTVFDPTSVARGAA